MVPAKVFLPFPFLISSLSPRSVCSCIRSPVKHTLACVSMSMFKSNLSYCSYLVRPSIRPGPRSPEETLPPLQHEIFYSHSLRCQRVGHDCLQRLCEPYVGKRSGCSSLLEVEYELRMSAHLVRKRESYPEMQCEWIAIHACMLGEPFPLTLVDG